MLLRTLEARETTALFISDLVSLRLDFLAFGFPADLELTLSGAPCAEEGEGLTATSRTGGQALTCG